MLETDAYKEALGKILKKLRGSEKQKEIARRARIDGSTLSDYENGHTVPNDESLARLAAAYDLAPEELYQKIFDGLAAYFGKESVDGGQEAVFRALMSYVESVRQHHQDLFRDSENFLATLHELFPDL